MGQIRVGTAGWSYADWNGIMYPKPMPRGFDRLAYLARYFDVVEVNSTFYAPAAPAVVDGWLAKTANALNFRFTIKLWQRFTHEREAAWTRADEQNVRASLDPLRAAGRLGAVLATVTSPVGYVRIHGRNYKDWFRSTATGRERYDYLYSPQELAPWVQRAEAVARATRDTYVITNNHNLGKAGVNALQLKALLLHHPVDVPPTLLACHPGALGPYAAPAPAPENTAS